MSFEGDRATCQALYILDNILHWREGQHKEVRKFLKKYTKDAKRPYRAVPLLNWCGLPVKLNAKGQSVLY